MKVFRLSNILILLGFSGIAFGQDVDRINVWYIDWDLYSRSDLTADHVRKNYYTHIEIVDADEAIRFAHDIDSRTFEPSPKSERADVRLVIDVLTKDGKTHTYVASKFRIYTLGGESSAKIDEKFRNKFRFGRKGPTTK